MSYPRRRLRRIALDPEEEFRVHQHPLQSGFYSILETAGAAPRLVEAHQLFNVRVGDRAAESVVRGVGENVPRAGLLVVRGSGFADEDARPARRVADALRI